MINTAFIALGSNLDNPQQQVKQAVLALKKHAYIEVIAVSPWYKSVALSLDNTIAGQSSAAEAQPDYINGVAAICTQLKPLALLDALQHLENLQGRQRRQRWGARTLDLDIVLYNQQTIMHQRLQVPHPELANRNFVLQPLLDLNPNICLPNGTTIAKLLANAPTGGMVRCSTGE